MFPKPWQTKGLAGVHRFLDRVWRLAERPLADGTPPDPMVKLLHRTIKKVSLGTDKLEFNTVISQMMIFIQRNLQAGDPAPGPLGTLPPLSSVPTPPTWRRNSGRGRATAPASPGGPFPNWDEALTLEDEVTVVVQINGKVRAKLQLPVGLDRDDLEARVREVDRVKEFLKGKDVKRVIAVPNRLVNFVAK